MTRAHCKDTISKIRNKYSQKRNCAAPVPIPTFMFLWAIYISLIGLPKLLQENRWTVHGNILIAHRHMNVEIGTEAAQFLFWEYINPNFFAVLPRKEKNVLYRHDEPNEPTKGRTHRLNMEVDNQSLFGLHVTWCAHLYSLAETTQLLPLSPHLARITRALLVSKDRRHLFVTPWKGPFICTLKVPICLRFNNQQGSPPIPPPPPQSR